MGIRFYCPSGHKLNVKEFQAGQRGICPVCGVKMQIPLQSTRASSREEKDGPQEGAIEVPPGLPTPESSPQAMAGTSTHHQPPKSGAPDKTDPLIDSGGSVWYVRPSSGGQYGPATAELMRTWIAEGRIVADALVWRAGWSNWQEAGIVFPQLPQTKPATPFDAIVTESLAAPVAPISARRRRALARNTQVWIVAGLVTTLLVLFAILIAVLLRA